MYNNFSLLFFLFHSTQKSMQNQENFVAVNRIKTIRFCVGGDRENFLREKKKKNMKIECIILQFSIPFSSRSLPSSRKSSWQRIKRSDKFYARIIVTREDDFFRLGKNTDLMWRPCFSGIVTTLIKLRSTVKRRRSEHQ